MIGAQAVWLPALAAGVLAVVVTRLIERLGGVAGGLLGSTPTTIVPAALGIHAMSASPEAFHSAMGAVPVGMAVNGVFLIAWRVVPPVVSGSTRRRLAVTSTLTLGVWFLVALASVWVMGLLDAAGVSALWVGAAAFLALELGGVLACARGVPAPKGARPVGPFTLVARGAMAAAAIGASALIAGHGGALLAGVAAVFPAIFLTTMVSLWWSQGQAVPMGAVGPLVLGSGSVSAYALCAAFSLPALGPGWGSLVAWVAAVVVVTVPAWWWLRGRDVLGVSATG